MTNRPLNCSAVILSFLFCAFCTTLVHAQVPDAVGHCVENCGGSSGSSGRSSSPTVHQPSPAEVERQQRLDRAHALNEQGRMAYNSRQWSEAEGLFERALQQSPDDQTMRGNLAQAISQQGVAAYKSDQWAQAESLFERALQHTPNDQTIKRNLQFAKEKFAQQQAEIEEQLQKKKLQEGVNALADSLAIAKPDSSSASASGKLDFLPAAGNKASSATPAAKPAQLDFMSNASESSTKDAGGAIHPAANPDNKALQQLRVAAGQSNLAKRTPNNRGASGSSSSSIRQCRRCCGGYAGCI